jgi:hypothetical protein
MANDLTSYSDGGDDPFAAYARAAAPHTGILLKFVKGKYLAGRDGDEVPIGTEFLADMEKLELGYVKWSDGRVVDSRVGLLAEGFQPPKRADLGDHDKAEWETGTDGQPRDPWAFSNALPLQRLDVDDDDDDEQGGQHTFVVSSKGGLSCIGELCKAYSEHRRQKPDELPVVALQSRSYQHAIKAYGRIDVPVLEVVGWEPREDAAEALPAPDPAPAPPLQPAAAASKPAPAVKPKPAAAPAGKQVPKKTDIPF